jgi:hypothetical protein
LSGILKAPWQVGLAAVATFVSAANYLQQALSHMFLVSESEALEHERQDALQNVTHNSAFDSVLGVAHFDDLSSRVFVLVGVSLLMMGIFLWIGAFRGGTRGVLTVTLAVSFLGGLIPLVLAFDPANGLNTRGLIEAEIVNLIALIFALLLWGRSGREWVAIGAKKKWNQD